MHTHTHTHTHTRTHTHTHTHTGRFNRSRVFALVRRDIGFVLEAKGFLKPDVRV